MKEAHLKYYPIILCPESNNTIFPIRDLIHTCENDYRILFYE